MAIEKWGLNRGIFCIASLAITSNEIEGFDSSSEN